MTIKARRSLGKGKSPVTCNILCEGQNYKGKREVSIYSTFIPADATETVRVPILSIALESAAEFLQAFMAATKQAEVAPDRSQPTDSSLEAILAVLTPAQRQALGLSPSLAPTPASKPASKPSKPAVIDDLDSLTPDAIASALHTLQALQSATAAPKRGKAK